MTAATDLRRREAAREAHASAGTPWKIGPVGEERARICIRAAELRARSVSYRDIAKELGLDSPLAAKKCAETGYGLAPGEDLRMARRRAADELDLIRRRGMEDHREPRLRHDRHREADPVPDRERGRRSRRWTRWPLSRP